MRDFALVACGMVLGWSLENAVWTLRPHLAAGWKRLRARPWRQWAHRVQRLRWSQWVKWARSRRLPAQWFRRSDPAVVAPTLPPAPQPGPRPIVGQRSTGGSHRAKQRQARFVGRSYRSRR